MNEYAFEVKLRAVVRVRAENEELACKVVPSVLGAPGSVEIGLANQNNAAIGNTSTVIDVEFYQEGRAKRHDGGPRTQRAESSTPERGKDRPFGKDTEKDQAGADSVSPTVAPVPR
jgi:hypothetical protein